MFKDRLAIYKKLEEHYNCKLLAYITGDRPGFETHINQDSIDIFIEHLNSLYPANKIALYLYTRGGNTASAWNIVNLIRQYCTEFIVIVPHKAHSSGTLISIGADSIIMTKQATLSPIDPSLNSPLNPIVQIPPLVPQSYPVSVEAIQGYIDFVKDEIHVKDDTALAQVATSLSDKIHPLVLGMAYRSRSQIRMLADKLLQNQKNKPKKEEKEKIIKFLCSDSGSHDYTLNRREARELGLNIQTPDEMEYKMINDIYLDISNELGLNIPYNLELLEKIFIGANPEVNSEINQKCAFIESVECGSNFFFVQGKISDALQNPQGFQPMGKTLNVTFDGWGKEKCED